MVGTQTVNQVVNLCTLSPPITQTGFSNHSHSAGLVAKPGTCNASQTAKIVQTDARSLLVLEFLTIAPSPLVGDRPTGLEPEYPRVVWTSIRTGRAAGLYFELGEPLLKVVGGRPNLITRTARTTFVSCSLLLNITVSELIA